MRRLQHQPWLRRGIQLVIILVPLAYVVRSLIGNWQALSDYDWHLNVLRAAGALIALLLARSLLGVASQQAFSGLGYPIDSRAIFRGYHISSLSMYLPGGLYVGRAVVFGEHGVDVVSSSIGVMIELSMLILSGMLGSVPYLLVAGTGALSRFRTLGWMLIPLTLSVLYPGLTNRVLRWLLARLGYEERGVNLTVRQLVNMLLLVTAYWLVAGVGFYLLVTSIYAVPSELFPVFASAFSLARVATIVLSATPGGLGVLEGALALLLAPFLPAPLPALVALLARLWTTVALLILFGLATLFGKNVRHTEVRVRGPLSEE
ncbi:MAG: hypothetical protein AMJ93_15915 [Anaerolineae bacterium SM23_84]|nr:MAG: hypothetical protein AMJ93_15915 [Anaerolineae bacterium SM23_84]